MTDSTKNPSRQRRMAHEPIWADPGVASSAIKAPSKLDQVAALLSRETGASIAEMMEATGWQQHSVRGAMAGALKKRGIAITSQKSEGVRRYRASRPA